LINMSFQRGNPRIMTTCSPEAALGGPIAAIVSDIIHIDVTARNCIWRLTRQRLSQRLAAYIPLPPIYESAYMQVHCAGRLGIAGANTIRELQGQVMAVGRVFADNGRTLAPKARISLMTTISAGRLVQSVAARCNSFVLHPVDFSAASRRYEREQAPAAKTPCAVAH